VTESEARSTAEPWGLVPCTSWPVDQGSGSTGVSSWSVGRWVSTLARSPVALGTANHTRCGESLAGVFPSPGRSAKPAATPTLALTGTTVGPVLGGEIGKSDRCHTPQQETAPGRP
jgi:hypothetical protein